MKKISLGQRVANCSFECTDPQLHSFADLKGKNVVLYFYPKDNTPGCTLEGKDFASSALQFSQLSTCIIGVSKDDLLSHHNFINQFALPFPLISDPEEKICRYFDVMREKKLFSRVFLGIERSTFLLDKQGILCHEWRKVKVPGHVATVLEKVKMLNRGI